MKIGSLFRYSLYLIILVLLTFMLMTIYIYFFAQSSDIEIAYNFVVPICMFVVSLLYSRSVHEKGLVRGIEIWGVYFVIMILLQIITKFGVDISMIEHLIYLPVSILGGVIGVNIKK